jgi:hypothetical protein
MRHGPFRPAALGVVLAVGLLIVAPAAPIHPRLLFDAAGLEAIRASSQGELAPIRARLMERATRLLAAAPLLVSTTKRGEPDPPGQLKGLEAARRLQGRVLTYGMAFLLSGEQRFRDAAVAELDHALDAWPIWVDTAHQPPFDLMTGEQSMTYGIAYDWLYDGLTPAERTRLCEGVERRALRGYLEATTRETPPFWFTATMNWNTVTNGGAAILALALQEDNNLSERVLKLAAPAMAHYWNHLEEDGAWAEGTGYWTYGHRYAFIAADALRRAGRPEGAEYLGRPGARSTGYFPIVFNPGRTLSASFGDSPGRAQDPLFYFLAREYRNPDFAWFEDRAAPRGMTREGWPDESLELVWKTPDRAHAAASIGRPLQIPAVKAFASIGWAMIAPSQPDPPFFLALKNGSLAAAHTHLDLNHVSIAVGDTMIVPDLGSRPYPADYFDANKRYLYYEISTAGHNTVLVGGKGQVPGKLGTLKGPVKGERFAALVGVADDAYEVKTARARRHVVFVDKSYFVLLDEIEPAEPAPVELRFHAYGAVSPREQGGWTVSENKVSVDIVPALRLAPSGVEGLAQGGLAGTVEAVDGWTRPVNVLRLRSTADSRRFLLATVIVPSTATQLKGVAVAQHVDGDGIRVDVGRDQLTWRCGADGCEFRGIAAR